MLKNYLKIGWRNLKKDKTFSLLNIVGLSVAFGVAILLSMSAIYELSFDKFHTNGNQLFKVYHVAQTPKGPEASTSEPEPLAKTIREEVAGVEKTSRYLQDGTVVTYQGKELNMSAVWVDNDLFSMFSFPIVKGTQENPLSDLSKIVLSEKMATALFGEEDPIGKTVSLLIRNKPTPFTVGAVAKNMPVTSSLKFGLAIRFENHYSFQNNKDQWDARYHDVFVQLQKGVNQAQFEARSDALVNLHYKNEIENAIRDGAEANSEGHYVELNLLPLKDVHFTNFHQGYANTSRMTPYLVLSIAFLILFIACVNFVNMSIAKTTERLREIGVRKTLGAKKNQLFFQFWSEHALLLVASLGIGIGLSVVLLNSFQEMFRTNASFDVFLHPMSIGLVVVVLLIISLIAGGYPSLILSKFGTVQSLKGKAIVNGKNRVRDVLMIVQFVIAILLINGTLVIWGQLDFMRNKNLGFDKSEVIAIPLNGKIESYRAVQLLREELKDHPSILNVSGSDNALGLGKDGSRYTSIMGFDYKDRVVKTNLLMVDYEYIETLGLELVHGRSFDRQFPGDQQSVVINERMALELGEEDPLTAKIEIQDSVFFSVIGVVKDYHFEDLTKSIEPLTFSMNKDWELYYAYVKVAPNTLATSFEAVQQAWTAIEPNAEFLGSFLDENIDRTFRSEKVMATMITSGSVIAILLSCIGLFAISLLIVANRTKEIGVRKVVGASISSITVLLTKDFLKLVVIALLVATPVAYWLMKNWLQAYVYRIELSAWFFVLAGGIAILVAVITVGFKTVNAAMMKPVSSLRSE